MSVAFLIFFSLLCSSLSNSLTLDIYQGWKGWLSAEDSMCSWLAEQCPFLTSLRRPVPNYSQVVKLTKITMSIKRLMELDDLEERFTLVAIFNVDWRMPDCAIWNSHLLRNVTELSDEAKSVEECKYPIDQIWYPKIRMPEAYYSPTEFDLRRMKDLTLTNNGMANIKFSGHFSNICKINYAVIFPNFPKKILIFFVC